MGKTKSKLRKESHADVKDSNDKNSENENK